MFCLTSLLLPLYVHTLFKDSYWENVTTGRFQFHPRWKLVKPYNWKIPTVLLQHSNVPIWNVLHAFAEMCLRFKKQQQQKTIKNKAWPWPERVPWSFPIFKVFQRAPKRKKLLKNWACSYSNISYLCRFCENKNWC